MRRCSRALDRVPDGSLMACSLGFRSGPDGDKAGGQSTPRTGEAGARQYNPLQMLRFLTAGESHGPQLTVIVEGVPAGISLDAARDTMPDGYLGFDIWWSLEDYWTTRPGIQVERFGLFRPDGTRRPVADAVTASFQPGAGAGDRKQIRSGGAGRPLNLRSRSDLFTAYLLYGVLSTFGLLGGILIVMWAFGRRRSRS